MSTRELMLLGLAAALAVYFMDHLTEFHDQLKWISGMTH
jgi:hypothetical protein